MTVEEVRELLRLASVLMNKPVPEGQPEAWSLLFGDVSVAYAKIALAEHCSESEFWPAPASIITRARAIEAEDAEAARVRALGAAAREDVPEFVPNQEGMAKLRYILDACMAVPRGQGLREQAALDALARWDETHPNGPTIEPRRNACENALCQCTHTDGCDAGFIEQPSGQVMACQTCRPRQHAIQTNSTSRREMGKLLRLPPEKPSPTAQQW